MSYTKTNWTSGDVITAEKLNNLESGVEATSDVISFVPIPYDVENYLKILRASYNDILSIVNDGKIPCVVDVYDYENHTQRRLYVFKEAVFADPGCSVTFEIIGGGNVTFIANAKTEHLNELTD